MPAGGTVTVAAAPSRVGFASPNIRCGSPGRFAAALFAVCGSDSSTETTATYSSSADARL